MVLSLIKTKCGRLSFVKEVVYSLGCGYVHAGDEYFDMFVELVGDRFPDLCYFSIVPNRRNYGSFETQAHMHDGSISVFSWNKLALGRVDSNHKKLRDVMRSAVVSDILAFKRDAVCCVLCGSINNLQADHIEPFRDLANSYINLHGDDGGADWVSGWVSFHKQNASLQILCSKCNYRKH